MDYFYTERPFSEEEESFVFHQQDFVAVEESEDSWLDSVMHRAMGHCSKGILRVGAFPLRASIEELMLFLAFVCYPRRPGENVRSFCPLLF